MWYTDAQLWREAEGDFDEQTTDDWDVDYSVYFEENGGDMVINYFRINFIYIIILKVFFIDHFRMPETPSRCGGVQ